MVHLKYRLYVGILGIVAGLGMAHSEVKQMPWEFNPPPRLIEDRLRVEVGVWNTTISSHLRSDDPELLQQDATELDAEHDLGLSDKGLFADIELVLLPGDRHLFRLSGLTSHRSGSAVLSRDVQFNGNTYHVGDVAKSTLNADMIGVGYAYRLVKMPRFELDAGVDVNITSIEANAYVPAIQFREADSGVALLPLLDIDSRVEILPKWQLQARYRWLGGSARNVNGQFLDWRAGVQWQFNQHVGLGLYYRALGLNVDSSRSDYPGAVRVDYKGAQLAFRASM